MQLSELLEQLARAKRYQNELIEFLQWMDKGLACKIRGCASWLHLRDYYMQDEVRVVNANFCKNRLLCGACARRWCLKAIMKYKDKIEVIQKEKPDLIPAMVTITVKNGPDLVERVNHIKTSWKRIQQRRRNHKNNPTKWKPVEWNKVEGSLRALEVTNKGKGWHPHFHVFTLLSEEIDQAKLSEEWKNTTKDSFVVDVRRCKNGIIAGLCEVIKYTTKFSELDPLQLWEVYDTLKGRQALSPAGILRGVDVGDINHDDLDPQGPFIDMVARWLWNDSERGYRLQGEQLLAS